METYMKVYCHYIFYYIYVYLSSNNLLDILHSLHSTFVLIYNYSFCPREEFIKRYKNGNIYEGILPVILCSGLNTIYYIFVEKFLKGNQQIFVKFFVPLIHCNQFAFGSIFHYKSPPFVYILRTGKTFYQLTTKRK